MTSTMVDRATQMAQRTRQRMEQMPRGREQAGPKREPNVGLIERMASVVLGGALASMGAGLLLGRRSYVGGALMALAGGVLAYRGGSGHCSAYEAVGVRQDDATTTSHPLSRAMRVSAEVTVNRPIDEVYAQWRDLENLGQTLRRVEKVRTIDEQYSHWTARSRQGQVVEWDARIVEDRPNELIAWETKERATSVPNRGEVRFDRSMGGEGTRIRVRMACRLPGGALGAAWAKLSGQSPESQMREDLRCFKQMVETGEVSTTEGQSRGTCR